VSSLTQTGGRRASEENQQECSRSEGEGVTVEIRKGQRRRRRCYLRAGGKNSRKSIHASKFAKRF